MNHANPTATAIKVKDGVHFVGAFDPDLRTFDIIMKTANGTSYNSYLIQGNEGDAIIDTVKSSFREDFFRRIEEVSSYDRIKYIILNHLEPDHSGALPYLLDRSPQAKVIASTKAKPMLKALVDSEIDIHSVKGGDEVSLGDITLQFLSTPFLHWPETMMTYVPERKILFSCDVFGAHYYDTRLFDDQVGDFDYAFKYYYDHIMRPFKSYVLSAMDLLKRYDFDTIGTSHGPVLRRNIQNYIDRYIQWSSDRSKRRTNQDKILVHIFYASSYGNTKKMAEEIQRGLWKYPQINSAMFDLEALEFENGVHLMEEADAFLVGSPTINGDAVKPVWDLLAGLAFIESKSKIAAAFGSFGWGGEAPMMVHDRLSKLKVKVPFEPLRVKLIPHDKELESCFQFGSDFAAKLVAEIQLQAAG